MNPVVIARLRRIELGSTEVPPLKDVPLEFPHAGLLVHQYQCLACGAPEQQSSNHMHRKAGGRCVQHESCSPDNLRLRNGAMDGTHPCGATMARHSHVGEPVHLRNVGYSRSVIGRFAPPLPIKEVRVSSAWVFEAVLRTSGGWVLKRSWD